MSESPDSSRPRTTETAAAPLELPLPAASRRFVLLYTLAFLSTTLLFLAPLLGTLALKINALVGLQLAPSSLALVAGVGAFLAMFANPFFGMLSDRTSLRLGRRRTWMLIGLVGGSSGVLVVALAPTIPAVLLGWCIAQVGFNALLAAMAAVLPDQVPPSQRGMVAGILGVCVPVASVAAAGLVNLFGGNQFAMFMAPCGIAGVFIILFALTIKDSRPAASERWSISGVARGFYVNPRTHPDFGWVFVSRFLLVLAYSFLTTFLAYYLIAQLRSAERDVPGQILLGTLVQSAVVVVASVSGGKLSDRTRRRKVFVVTASVLYGIGMFALALAGDVTAYLIAMGIAGLGFGLYLAVDLALVVDVLPKNDRAATHLGILNMASALPTSIAPAIAPAILLLTGGSYAALYTTAGACALLGAIAVLPIRGAR
ncbi:MAG: major facilitator superfamily 1 [Glaciihabitans sp.]|nr:major facilitator superfamily 1 [Glaciihabitans sp.]